MRKRSHYEGRKGLFAPTGLLIAMAALFPALTSSCAALGENPGGERLRRIEASPHYVDGAFANLEPTPMNTGEDSSFKNYWNFLFNDWERIRPEVPLSMVKTDLESLPDGDLLLWLGHSSLYVQLEGVRMLVDPVFMDYASPVFFLNTAFKGDYPYSVEDFIARGVDVVLITHDHYDHLEMDTVHRLGRAGVTFICPLGVGQHLESWGVSPENILEGDWGDSLNLYGLNFNFVTARHFSGRFINGNQTLWTGYMIECKNGAPLYISGDSGYGTHFEALGERFPAPRLALLECGQYNPNWALIHMTPEETARAGADVKAKAVLPLHTGRFALSSHTWDDPYLRLEKACQAYDYQLLTPRMGEIVWLDGRPQSFTRWYADDAAREARYLKEEP